jgi:hypothetical protein
MSLISERIRRPKKEAFDALIHGQKGRFRLIVSPLFHQIRKVESNT